MRQNGREWESWSLIFTRLGYCYHFKPPNLTWSDENTGKNQLSVTIAFNQSDFVLGWAHSRDDLTLFIDANSSNPNPSPSLTDNVKVVKGMNPIIELNQLNTSRVGGVRSPCCWKNASLEEQVDESCGETNPADTEEFQYSYNNCMEKCLVKQIMESCNCSLPWFKFTYQCDKNFVVAREDCEKIRKLDEEGYCPFTRHVQCVSSIMVNQKNKCRCIPSCKGVLSYNYKIQYEGIHQHDFRKLTRVQKNNHEIVNLDLASFAISLNDDYETRREEKLDYPLLSLVSDIGGTAGLIAGMSLATLCGIIDFFATLVLRMAKALIFWVVPAPITRLAVFNLISR
ncbi:Oidioi.mRNA.OKI2018_I69.XSR.g16820.t1.cds [Oikopleura dioica]|uniref:Oidioi.mRNA.OKI2018_I69.XSR.g16820.t1.cds n=1 Tax=Oikopleura dioica TaxID=34765 RepID=A0ABN7SL70_OIKDI|nr:Oidioi.mRNA.OKI2018_I69.XSR.g16820.t1.cds [Oikopleura dioica]